MRLYIAITLLSLVTIGCISQPVVLTPEGMKVNLIGNELAQSLPGRPLDKCTIAGHSEIIHQEIMGLGDGLLLRNPSCKNEADLKTELRNDVASKGGNVGILTMMERSRSGSCWIGIRGIAIKCDDATLKAAGFGLKP